MTCGSLFSLSVVRRVVAFVFLVLLVCDLLTLFGLMRVVRRGLGVTLRLMLMLRLRGVLSPVMMLVLAFLVVLVMCGRLTVLRLVFIVILTVLRLDLVLLLAFMCVRVWVCGPWLVFMLVILLRLRT